MWDNVTEEESLGVCGGEYLGYKIVYPDGWLTTFRLTYFFFLQRTN